MNIKLSGNKIPKEVIEAFTNYEPDLPDHSAGEITIEKLGGGLINNSYKVSCQLKSDFFLQKINKSVFTNPETVQRNYIHIWQYAEFEFTGLQLPAPKYYSRMKTLFVDENGAYWRAFDFINNSKMYTIARTPAQAKATAKTFARFTKEFNDFNIDQLHEVIPNFHNLSFRYQQFEDALKGELYERIAKALPLIQELKIRERYKHFYELIIKSDQFVKRVMHHDAKIANVLFDKKTGKVICPVDFDTVMPGYYFSDLGDMIRSMAGNKDENSIDFDRIKIRKNYYDAIIAGYLKEMKEELTNAEKEHIHYAGLLMIYMQALRFITDYSNGDTYYQISYPEQNFDRAKNQLTLLQRLEEFLEEYYDFKKH